jgi:hypothetical protein
LERERDWGRTGGEKGELVVAGAKGAVAVAVEVWENGKAEREVGAARQPLLRPPALAFSLAACVRWSGGGPVSNFWRRRRKRKRKRAVEAQLP